MPVTLLDETLGAGAVVRLFGREFLGLKIADDGNDAFLPRAGAGAPKLARIYAFSYQGGYVKLTVPTVLLVYGEGKAIEPAQKLAQVGVEAQTLVFAADVLWWAAHDVDLSVRIDITTGWLADILITPEAGGDSGPTGDGGDPTARSMMAGRSMMTGRSMMAARSMMAGR